MIYKATDMSLSVDALHTFYFMPLYCDQKSNIFNFVNKFGSNIIIKKSLNGTNFESSLLILLS